MKTNSSLFLVRLISPNQLRSLVKFPVNGFLLACLAAAMPATAQNVWNGLAGDTNWSTAGNWSFNAIPNTGDLVLFDNVVPGTNAALVDNIVNSDFTINTLSYATVSTNGFHTTLIPSGRTLNIVSGSGGNAISVASGVSQPATGQDSYERFVGAGTLNVTNTTGFINVMQFGADVDHRATLDMSGLTNFSADVQQVRVATTLTAGEQFIMAAWLLGETNYIHTPAGVTAPGILVGSMDNASTGRRGTQQLFLGQHNTIHSDTVVAGGFKMAGNIQVRTGLTNGVATFRGSAGGSDPVKILAVGDHKAGPLDFLRNGTSAAVAGSFDTTGLVLDLLATDIFVARSQTNNSGLTTGSLTFDKGSIVADNVFVGYHPTPSAPSLAFNATGTLSVNGSATMTVNNDLVLGRKVGTALPVATVNISTNATLNVKGNLVTAGGTSTLNLNGGTLNLQPSGDATPGNATVGTLNGSGSILNGANITNSTSLTVGDAITAATINLGGNFMLSNNAPVNMNLATTTTVGAGVNDLLNVTGNLILSSNVVNISPLGTSLAAGSYRLINYTGTRTGFLSFTNPTRYNIGQDYATANQVNLVVTSGAPASLTWKGTNGNWNLTTSNWNNSTEKFLQLDAVTFDNAGLSTNITIAQQSFPSAVTVNSSTNYYFAGSGKISGATGLTKNGTGVLRVSTANDFTGPVTISAGTLQAGNSTALGTTNGGTTVASGATLDVAGTSLFNPGEFITISGAGVGGNGAIINSGADQNNGIRFVSLAADASVGSGAPGRWDIRGPVGNGSFSGGLFLNGFTLTKLGVGKISLVDSIITNAGSLVLSNGTMGLTRSIIDGPGTITGFGTNTFQLENSTTGYITKPFVYNLGGGVLECLGNAFTLFSPITNNGGLTISNSVAFTLTNIYSGPGALTKNAAGNLIFQAPNLSTGPTTISAGRVTIGTNSSISATPRIAVAAGATFDVSQLTGGLTLASGQVLSGSGTVIGDVSVGANSGIVPGSSAGTLTFSNNLALNNSSNVFELNTDPTQIGNNVNDLTIVSTNLTLSGVNTIKIVPVATLNNASPYTLFQYGGTLTGGGANLTVGSDSRYSFTVVDPTTTPGSIQVSVAGSGTSANLVWKGGAAGNPTAWDTKITTNWLNSATPDKFFLGDNVAFDDTAATNRATLVGTIQPAALAMSNNVLSYSFSGSGNLIAGSLSIEGSAGLSISNTANNTVAAPATVDTGSLTLANIGQNTFGAGLFQNAGSVLVANAAPNDYGPGIVLNGGTMTFAHPLNVNVSSTISNAAPSIAGTIVKEGSTMLTLSGNNTNFEGPILVNAGTLRAGNNNALGTGVGGTTLASGATLDINGFALFGSTLSAGDLITISGAGLSSTGAVINTGGAQNNAVRAITLAANASIGSWNQRWDIRGNGGTASFSGGLNLGGFTLTKLGAGRVSVADANMTDAGSVEVTGGTLAFTRVNVDGAGYINIGPNNLLLENNSGTPTFAKPLIFSNALFQVVGNALTITSPITNSGNSMFDLAVNLTASGVITGPGGITKSNAGTLILTEANDYAGGTFINSGVIQIGVNGTSGVLPPQPGGSPLTNNGSIIFNRSDDITMNDRIVGSGGLTQIGGGTVFLTVSNSYSGQTFLNTTAANSPGGAAVRISHAFALGDTNGNTRIAGNTAGNGRLEIVGGISVAEPFQVDARQSTDADIPSILNVSGSNTLTGLISGNTGGTEYNFQSDAGKLTVTGAFIPPSTAGTRRLKLMGTAFGEWSGVISNSTDTLVVAHVNKTNSGTWTLSAANVYGGNTTVGEGTLKLAATGSINNSPIIDVQTGATFDVSAVPGGFVLGAAQTLMGNGAVVGNVTAAGTVSPGASIGALTFANNLVLSGTTVMEIDRLAGPNADLITANSLTYGGTLVVTNSGTDPLQASDVFNLFDWTSRSGSFGSVQLPPLDPGLSWNTANLNVNGSIQVVGGGPTLTFQVTGNSLEISWPVGNTGWLLQSQTNPITIGLSNNWGEVADSTTTNRIFAPIVPSQGSTFYRLISP